MKLYSHSPCDFLFDPHYELFNVPTLEDFLGLLFLLNSDFISLWNVVFQICILTYFLSCSVNCRGWRMRSLTPCALLYFCFRWLSSTLCILETKALRVPSDVSPLGQYSWPQYLCSGLSPEKRNQLSLGEPFLSMPWPAFIQWPVLRLHTDFQDLHSAQQPLLQATASSIPVLLSPQHPKTLTPASQPSHRVVMFRISFFKLQNKNVPNRKLAWL